MAQAAPDRLAGRLAILAPDEEGAFPAVCYPTDEGVFWSRGTRAFKHVDEYHPALVAALREGVVDFSGVAARLELERRAAELYAELGADRARSRRDRGRLALEE